MFLYSSYGIWYNINNSKEVRTLTLSYSSEINAVLCPQRISTPLKKKNAMKCPQMAVLPIQSSTTECWQIKMAICRIFFKNLILLGRVWEPAKNRLWLVVTL